MKTRTNAILIMLVLLAYFCGLRSANAFYDPGTQRWLNRDPLGEPGFIRINPELRLLQKNLHVYANRSIQNPTFRTAVTLIPWEGIPAELDQYADLYVFVGNEPIAVFDFEGLSGCGDCYGDRSANTACWVEGVVLCAPTLLLPFNIIIYLVCTDVVHNACCFIHSHI